ncbi:hypothetical protein [Litorisediminicola beolgyonensis]|uniref:Uncharacterized protein n=1 Tax=Litorisediminicola beolgyonensis TaxID=1173614 RepID=A0ABW3ZH57_9RHOB
MPVTSFALLVLAVIGAAGLTVVALNAWGLWTVLPLMMVLAAFARWALGHVPFDDSHQS